ncbi:unnamed protein product [Polarella glacialis]|uniref:Uncharacterized protein n=1 Tax=Polarella glacialis TaxID=89957 RepID=A0A813HWL9_POLGL|nr:unnamed protein product [Polarella glacialis]
MAPGGQLLLAILASLSAQVLSELQLPAERLAAAVEPLPPSGAEIAALERLISQEQRSPESAALAEAAREAVARSKAVPETLEDVEVRWLGVAFAQIARFLSESPLSSATKASKWMLGAEKHEKSRSRHQSAVLSLLGTLGMPLAPSPPVDYGQRGSKVEKQHLPQTMFGGLPWPLLLPVVLGVALAVVIHTASVYSDWKERKDKLLRGDAMETDDLGY